MDRELNLCSAARRSRLLPVPILLAIALCVPALPVHAEEFTGPDGQVGAASSEDEGTAESMEEEPFGGEPWGEEQEPPPVVEPEDAYQPRDGATARRELLFRDGLYERQKRYPKGLEPVPPIERDDIDAFDARNRGRNAQILRQTPPGWTVNGSITAGMQIDDNPLLETPEESAGQNTTAWGYVIEPGISVARRTPVSLFQGTLRLPYDDLNYFEDSRPDDLGSFDQFAGLQYDLFGRENAVNAFVNIANTTTRIAIVEDTGTNLSDNRALTYGGGGSIKHTLTANSVIQISAAGRRQNIDQGDLDDSTFYQVAGDYRALVTRSDTVGIGASFQQFLPEGIDAQSADIITALASWSRIVRPSLIFDVEAGAQIISGEDIGDPLDEGTRISPYAEASLYWAVGERDSLSFTIGHSADPSATGDLRTTTHIELDYRHEISKQFAFGVPFLVLFQDPTLENDFDNRTFVQVAPNLAWSWGLSWGLAFEYRFRLNQEAGASTATSNAAFLTLGYFGRLFP